MTEGLDERGFLQVRTAQGLQNGFEWNGESKVKQAIAISS